MGEQVITFCLQGAPYAWKRAKISRSNRIDGRGVRVFKDKGDRAHQTALALEATSAMMRWRHENDRPWDPEGEWHITMDFFVPDRRRKDIDNLEKTVLDALSTVVYTDDANVVSVTKSKRLNRANPRTIVTCTKVSGYLAE